MYDKKKEGELMEQRNKTALFWIVITFAALLIGIVYSSYISINEYSHKRFGVTYMTMNNPFYKVIHNEILKGVENNGDELICLDPALDIEKQQQQIYSFIEQKVDGIFVNPIDSTQIKDALLAAKKAGIPVIAIDAPVNDENLVTCTIASDNYDAGVQCAKDMMKRKEAANIVLLKHSTVKSAKDRIDGFVDTIKQYPQYCIVDEEECEGQLEIAMPKMQKILNKTKDIDVVMALNDPSALGVMAALEQAQKNNVIVYGVDGTPDVKSLINRSDMVAGTVAQSPIQIGKIAVKTMNSYLAGEKIEKEIVIPVELINGDNIQSYDETGWQ